jgi:hypothetical protein
MHAARMKAGGGAFATALAVSLALGPAAHAGNAAAEYTDTVELTFPLKADGDFALRNTNGPFTLTTWDKNEVRIVAEKRMRLDDGAVSWLMRLIGVRGNEIKTDEQARKLFEELAVEVTGDEARREVNTVYPETLSGIQYSVAYTVTAPRAANVSVDTRNGRIRIDGVGGRVAVESTNGSIDLYDVPGETVARSTNGRIAIKESGGNVSARTTNGSINIALQRDVASIDKIHARSVNGSVSVAVPAGAGFDFHGRTVHGSVGCDFDLADARARSKKELEGRAGAGGPRVELQTTNGSLKLEKLD